MVTTSYIIVLFTKIALYPHNLYVAWPTVIMGFYQTSTIQIYGRGPLGELTTLPTPHSPALRRTGAGKYSLPTPLPFEVCGAIGAARYKTPSAATGDMHTRVAEKTQICKVLLLQKNAALERPQKKSENG